MDPLEVFTREVFHISVALAVTLGNLDEVPATYVNDFFWGGEEANVGSATMAAVGWRHPEMSTHGHTPLLCTRQALAGFGKLAPPRTRLRHPSSVVAAVANELRQMGHRRVVILVKIGETLYLRPGSFVV